MIEISDISLIRLCGEAFFNEMKLYFTVLSLSLATNRTCSGTVERSGLGLKLMKRELLTTQAIVWETILAVKNYNSFSDCSTAIVS